MERPEEDGDDADPRTRFDPTSFVGLLIGFATQAQIFLGVIENPLTRKKEEVDLPRAKHMVDVLGMLDKKTAGNLTDDEAAFLKRILADLRMRYVQAVSGGAPPAE
ncbi:MAG: DUF1844 domain-containing protein [Planctomycetes bacterium]|nr:DUF1844 domain-containing protein [Planctomycetota bacterium]